MHDLLNFAKKPYLTSQQCLSPDNPSKDKPSLKMELATTPNDLETGLIIDGNIQTFRRSRSKSKRKNKNFDEDSFEAATMKEDPKKHKGRQVLGEIGLRGFNNPLSS